MQSQTVLCRAKQYYAELSGAFVLPFYHLILPFHHFVCLIGVRGQHEGLVHISQLRKEGRVNDVGEVARRGQRVKVKVLGITGNKISLSMKVRDTFLVYYTLS